MVQTSTPNVQTQDYHDPPPISSHHVPGLHPASGHPRPSVHTQRRGSVHAYSFKGKSHYVMVEHPSDLELKPEYSQQGKAHTILEKFFCCCGGSTKVGDTGQEEKAKLHRWRCAMPNTLSWHYGCFTCCGLVLSPDTTLWLRAWFSLWGVVRSIQ